MSKVYPFDFVRLGEGWTIKVNQQWSGDSRAGMLCIGTSGLFETGSSTNSGTDRVFRDGTVLPSKNIVSGKRFSMSFAIMGSVTHVYSTLEAFQTHVIWEQFDITTPRGSINNCRGQQVTIETERYKEDTITLEISVDIVSSEPRFNFLF